MDGTDGNSINMLKAIVDATNDQVDIINVSLGSYKNMEIDDERFTVEAFRKAVNYARKNNILIVASAGNESRDISTGNENIYQRTRVCNYRRSYKRVVILLTILIMGLMYLYMVRRRGYGDNYKNNRTN